MPQEPKTAGPSSRGLRLALVASLALNLLFVGLAVGAAFNWRSGGGPPRSFDLSVGPLGRALEPEDRRAITEALRERARIRPPSRSDREAMAREVVQLLREEPFDLDRFADLLSAQRSFGQEVQAAAQTVFVARIAGLSAQERADLADRVERQLGRDGHEDRRN